MTTLTIQTCDTCGERKTIDAFWKRHDKANGYASTCRDCRKREHERLGHATTALQYQACMEAADSWCQRLEEAQAAPTLPARIQRVLALSPAGFPLRDIASMVGYRGPRMDRLMGYLDALAVSMTRQCQQWDRSRREWVPGIKTLYKAK